jgi:hypothetical protein
LASLVGGRERRANDLSSPDIAFQAGKESRLFPLGQRSLFDQELQSIIKSCPGCGG